MNEITPEMLERQRERAQTARRAVAQDQSDADRAIIKIEVIENAILVKAGPGKLAFPDWSKASAYINARIEALKAKRTGGGS